MLQFLESWVLSIASVAILIVAFEIIMPSGRIKRVVNLISGFILVIAMLNPILGLFKKGFSIDELQIMGSSFINKKEIEESSRLIKENQNKQIVEVYRNNVIEQLEESAKLVDGVDYAEADVIINEDENSESFGAIKRVYLNISLNDNKSGIQAVERVKKIEIKTRDKPDSANTAVKSKAYGEAIKKLEDKINSMFGVVREDIVISIL